MPLCGYNKSYALQLWRDKTITHGPVLGIGKNAVTAKEFLGKDECIVIYRNGSETIAFNKVTKGTKKTNIKQYEINSFEIKEEGGVNE